MISRATELAKSRRRVAAERDARERGQQGLFGDPTWNIPPDTPPAPPRRLSSPPCTSRMALEKITTSGKRAGQMGAIVNFLRTQTTPMTSYEIAVAIGVDRSGPGRRMSDLEVAGFVRRRSIRTCSISGAPSITWEAT